MVREHGIVKGSAGFTLVELLATIGVMAILGVLAAPGMQGMVIDSRLSTASIELRSSIELARSEAMGAGRRAGLCRSSNPNGSTPVCSQAGVNGRGGTDWGIGWIVYVKGDPDTGDAFAPGDRLLRRVGPFGIDPGASWTSIWAPVPGPLVFGWNGVRSAGPVGAFSFDFGPSTTTRPSPLNWRSPTCLHVNAVGRIDVRPPAGGACT
jgi:prepilin-type N-terminal cleavage/methylation domain-containing protein